MAKYTTINYYNKKRTQQTTEDYELACARCEKGGKVILKKLKILMYEKK